MVVFYATGLGVVDDLWSEDYKAPKHDAQQDYIDTNITKEDGYYRFITYRALDTGDSLNDVILKCENPQTFKWVSLSTSANLMKHNEKGSWIFNCKYDEFPD